MFEVDVGDDDDYGGSDDNNYDAERTNQRENIQLFSYASYFSTDRRDSDEAVLWPVIIITIILRLPLTRWNVKRGTGKEKTLFYLFLNEIGLYK